MSGVLSEDAGLSGVSLPFLGCSFAGIPPGLPVQSSTGLTACLLRDGEFPAADAEAEQLGIVPLRLGVAASLFLALRRLGPLQFVGQAFLPPFFELFWCRLYPGPRPFGPVRLLGGLADLGFPDRRVLGFLEFVSPSLRCRQLKAVDYGDEMLSFRGKYPRVSKADNDSRNLETQLKELQQHVIPRNLIFTDVAAAATSTAGAGRT